MTFPTNWFFSIWLPLERGKVTRSIFSTLIGSLKIYASLKKEYYYYLHSVMEIMGLEFNNIHSNWMFF